ncbi:hypothetical protein YPPY47_3314, partial [Yersinia pestis PY-47]
MAKKI